MWHAWRWVGFGAVVLTLLATAGTDEAFAKKKKEAPKVASFAATPEEYRKIANLKELAGSILTIDAVNKSMTIRVDTPHTEPNPNYRPPKNAANNPNTQQYTQLMNTYRDLQRQQQLAAQARNPAEKQRALQRVQQDMVKLQQQQAALQAKMMQAAAKGKDGKVDANNQPFITVSSFKDYDLSLTDEVVVRKLFLPLEYDDTGNVKKYTEEEKKALRGKDTAKPGYVAKIDEVQPSQEVRLSLIPPKAGKKAADSPKDEMPNGPVVTMIVMTKELPGGGIPAAPVKKGKK